MTKRIGAKALQKKGRRRARDRLGIALNAIAARQEVRHVLANERKALAVRVCA